MGMFTSCYATEGGVEYQIKTGDDDCDTYIVGKPPKHGYRYIPDGVYDGLGDDFDDKVCKLNLAMVAIKDNICVEIVPYGSRENLTLKDQYIAICAKHGIPSDGWEEFISY